MTPSDSTWTAPSSRRTNRVALVAALACVVGIVVGLYLPWDIWRSGGEVVLGDFALLCLLGALAWRFALPETGEGGIGGLGTVAATTILTLAAREWTWRRLPEALGVLHGVAVCLAVALFVGPAVIDALEREQGLEWSAETVVRLALGLLIAVWMLVALV